MGCGDDLRPAAREHRRESSARGPEIRCLTFVSDDGEQASPHAGALGDDVSAALYTGSTPVTFAGDTGVFTG